MKLEIPSNQTRLVSGTFGAASYSGLKGAVVQATGGPLLFTGEAGAQIHLQDCDLTIRGATLSRFWRALRPQGGSLTVEDCAFTGNCQDIMAGATRPCVIRRCTFRDSDDSLKGSSDDMQGDPTTDHAIYVSFDSHDAVIEDCEVADHTGTGCHLNGNDGSDSGSSRGPQHGVKISNLRLFRCGSDGTHAFQPDNNTDAVVDGLLIVDPPVGPLAFYHNGMGASFACKRWTLRGVTIWARDARTNIHVCQGTEDIAFNDSIFVMANDALVSDAEGGGDTPYMPTFERCHFYYHDAAHVPAEVRNGAGNRCFPIAEAAALFPAVGPGAPASAYVSVDSSVAAGWRPATMPAPTPQPVPTFDRAAVLARLAAVEVEVQEIRQMLKAA